MARRGEPRRTPPAVPTSAIDPGHLRHVIAARSIEMPESWPRNATSSAHPPVERPAGGNERSFDVGR